MKSGIYKIICVPTGKFYIGSAILLKNRWYTHLYHLRNKHHNKYLQIAFNKHGEENFKFEVIEYCEKDQLIIREQHYIDTLKPHFNIRKIADSSIGVTMSEEGKKKLSDFWLGKKRPQTKEHKKNLCEALKGKLKGRKISQEQKDSLSTNRLGKGNPMFGSIASNAISILRIDESGNQETFTSLLKAAELINTCLETLKKKIELQKRYRGFIFKYNK